MPIGLTAIPIVGGINLLAGLLASGRGVDSTAGRSGVHLALADVVEAIGRPVAGAVVAAVVIVFVRQLAEREPVGFVGSYRGMWQRFGRVVLAQLLATLGVAALLLSVIGIPFAAWKFVGWQFVQQEVLFEDKPIREAFRGSSELVRGRWWHTVRVAGFLWLVGIVAGPVRGLRPDLHQLLPVLDQCHRLSRLRTARPLYRHRPHPPLLRSAGSGGGGTGEALARPGSAAQARRRSGARSRAVAFAGVKLLAFSDLHRDLGQAAELVEMSAEADVVIGAGDFASVHEGLGETIEVLAAIETPTILVPGNNETEQALREAAAGWGAATVLHGGGADDRRN